MYKYCNICGSKSKIIFSSFILNKYEIKYYYCDHCSFLSTEDPYWIDEAYHDSINKCDTGIMQRNITNSTIASSLIYFYFSHNKHYLDYAGGYGILTRMMRDIGHNFYWYDPYTKNNLAMGFEYNSSQQIELITSFEAFEHFIDALKSIQQMFDITQNIFFSTLLLPKKIPSPQDWWYYGLNHGQHISFYSEKMLFYIANKFGNNFYSNGQNFHIFTTKKLNPQIFSLLTNYRVSFFLSLFIRRLIKSKTWEDSLAIKK